MASTSQYSIEPLSVAHNKKSFSCGVEALDLYLINMAGQDAKRYLSATFVLVENQKETILGYYTLSSMSIALDVIPEMIRKKLPRYPMMPATLLGRLAIDKNAQGKLLGERLLVDALRRSLEANRQIVSWAVIVDAINDKAVSFYKNFGFIPFEGYPMRLFLSMGTIQKLFLEKSSISKWMNHIHFDP